MSEPETTSTTTAPAADTNQATQQPAQQATTREPDEFDKMSDEELSAFLGDDKLSESKESTEKPAEGATKEDPKPKSTTQKLPEKLAFEVAGEIKEFTPEELKKVVNESDYLRRANVKFEEAAALRKEATALKSSIETFVQDVRKDPAGTVFRLLAEYLGDEELARGQVIQHFRNLVKPWVEEENLSPEQKALRRAERQAQAARQQVESLAQRQAEEERRKQQEAWQAEEAEVEQQFQVSVAEELTRLGSPNDRITLFIYNDIVQRAEGKHRTLDPATLAGIIKEQRDKMVPQAPSSNTAADRARRIEAARQKAASGLRPGTNPRGPQSPRSAPSGAPVYMTEEQFNAKYGL